MIKDMINIGLRIREIREQKRITQTELSQKIKCTPTALSRWESGKRIPTFESVERVANALDISISELCGEERPEAYAVVTQLNNLGTNEGIVFCSNCKHILISSGALNYCEKCGSKLKLGMSSGKIEFDPVNCTDETDDE